MVMTSKLTIAERTLTLVGLPLKHAKKVSALDEETLLEMESDLVELRDYSLQLRERVEKAKVNRGEKND
jgi:hypothetical protein